MIWLWLAALAATIPAMAQTPAFSDPQRAAKLKAAFPEIEKVMAKWAEQRGAPGMSWGIVIDGETALVKTMGYRDWPSKKPVEEGTPFRIASMTKSFTSLSILKLRDEGKLSLDDDVAKWIPEVGQFRYPTTDTAPLRVRQLLTHGAGFPEDNPWGDQQLDRPFDQLTEWLRVGLPWSTPPDTSYEYSNYGFGMLGRIVERASGRSYRDYLENEILKPLGMTHSTLEPAEAKDAAVGYRREGKDYRVEPSLAHGAFGAMGGLVTTAPDLARYVAFHLSAYPPRDGAETGPVRRSSVREMQRLWRANGGVTVRRTAPDQPLLAQAGGYGYGLRISSDCRFEHIVGHGGGLPGFGSYMMWLPDYGVGLFAMANLTYSAPTAGLDEALSVMRRTGALQTRELAPSPILTKTQQALFALWNDWKPAEAERIAANNLFLDKSAETRQAELAGLKKIAGQCQLSGPVRAENWLRGEFDLACERSAIVRMSFTLAPTSPEATVQFWGARTILPFGAAMNKAAQGALNGKELTRVYGSCKLGSVLAGDGTKNGVAQLDCAKGKAELELALNDKGKVTRINFMKSAREACIP
jgi:CubicO group peptidase (beta-lactamase class C family)